MRKLFLALCMLAAGTGLGMGSGGFSSVDADRAVTVDVVGDEHAYMSLDYSDETETVEATSGTTEVEFVTVANHFTEPVDFRIDFTVDDGDNQIRRESVDIGQRFSATVTLECDSSNSTSPTATIDFQVVADGDGVWAKTTAERTVKYEVECE